MVCNERDKNVLKHFAMPIATDGMSNEKKETCCDQGEGGVGVDVFSTRHLHMAMTWYTTKYTTCGYGYFCVVVK